LRAYEIIFGVLCINIGITLVATMGVFHVGPTGIGNTTQYFGQYLGLSFVVGLLVAGGISWFGMSVKLPAVLTTYLALYMGNVAFTDALLAQFLSFDSAVAAMVSAPLTLILVVIGIIGALQISGGGARQMI